MIPVHYQLFQIKIAQYATPIVQCFTIRYWIHWNCEGLRRIRPTRWVIYFKCSHRAFLVLPRIFKSSLADLCWSLQRLATIRCVLQKLARFGRSCYNMQDFAEIRWALLNFARLGNNLLRLALFGIDWPDYAEILVLDPPVAGIWLYQDCWLL